MSSTTVWTPSESVTSRLIARVSSSESVSGISTASVRSGPKARAQRATVTELSIPPETATTAPRRRSSRPTIRRSASTIVSVVASASIRRTSGETAVLTRRSRPRASS